MESTPNENLVYLVILGTVLGGAMFFGGRIKINKALQQIAIWALIFLMVIIAYSFKDRLRAQIFPQNPTYNEAGDITVNRSHDGHFRIELEINDTPVTFLIDTGATNTVLNKETSREIGIDPVNLKYLSTAYTANGEVKTAKINIAVMKLGTVRDYDVTAFVNDGELDEPLLGMDYLSNFSKIEISGNALTLTR